MSASSPKRNKNKLMKSIFTTAEQQRYSRQILFKSIGEDGQQQLLNRKVLIIGCGGLGSVSAVLLARAGVGYLRIIDRDFIELDNLQRQILFDENDIREGLPKAIAAKHKLEKINSTITVEAMVEDVNRFNIEAILEKMDLVIDATDNFETRFLVNDACIKHHLPWIYGACVEAYGISMNIIPGKTPCLRCVIENMPPPGSQPTCETVGIINPIVNLIASVQCAETLKILTGNFDQLRHDLITIDLWKNQIQSIDISNINKAKNCPVCNYKQFEILAGKVGTTFTSLCGRNAVQILPFQKTEIDLMQLAIKLSVFGDPIYNDYFLKFQVEPYELNIFPDGRAIIKGTTDGGIARGLYNKYVGN